MAKIFYIVKREQHGFIRKNDTTMEVEPFFMHVRVGKATTLNGARRAVDRRDMQHGAYVHSIQDEHGRRVL